MRVISGKARGTKLDTIDSDSTRPTLDRVKESLFNIIQNKIEDSVVLDLFAGSGAIGIEFISRGAKCVYFCDKSQYAYNIIKHNLQKTKFEEFAIVKKLDYKTYLDSLKQEMFDIIFLDPPYEANLYFDTVKKIKDLKLLNKSGFIIIETDNLNREISSLKKLGVNILDSRKYGRINLIFLNFSIL